MQFFFIFFFIVMAETWLLLKFGGWIGALPTIAMVVVTAAIGSYLVKKQSLSTIRKAQMAQMQGKTPALEVVEGIILLMCAVLLITPGFFTDFVGFLLLVPQTRRNVAKKAAAGLAKHMVNPEQAGGFHEFRQGFQDPPEGFGQQPRPKDDDVIEGEFRERDK